MLVRARLEATAEANDQVEVGIRLSTGTTTSPVSTNETLGKSGGGGFNKYNVTFDRAYLKVKAFSGLTFLGGRIANPFFQTDLVWDPDVAFDGIAATYQQQIRKPWITGFAALGAFPLKELEFHQADMWLFGGQAGLELKPSKKISGKLGVAYYYYRNTQGVPNDSGSSFTETDFSEAVSRQKGNAWFYIDTFNMASTKVGLAAKFRELNVTGTLDIGLWDPIRVVLSGDYVKNLGFNRQEVMYRTSMDEKWGTEGYQVGLSVGHPEVRNFGQWRVFGSYRYVGSDAIIDAFTDSDFHLGGTNAKGWILGGELGLKKNLWLSTRWVTTDWINPKLVIPSNSANRSLGIDSLYLDLNYKF
jgi:hypothetical protein